MNAPWIIIGTEANFQLIEDGYRCCGCGCAALIAEAVSGTHSVRCQGCSNLGWLAAQAASQGEVRYGDGAK